MVCMQLVWKLDRIKGLVDDLERKKKLCFPLLSYITDLQEKAECDHFACAKKKKS